MSVVASSSTQGNSRSSRDVLSTDKKLHCHKRMKINEPCAHSNSVLSNMKKHACDQRVSPRFPVLTPQMKAIVDDILMFGPLDEVVCEGFDTSLTRDDLRRLCGEKWLNDHVIDVYMSLIVERSKQSGLPSVFAFTTFFYPKLISGGHEVVKRWTKKVDIFSYDLILVPVYRRVHWCLAVVDFKAKKIKYYDSVSGNNNACLLALRDYLVSESLDKRNLVLDMKDWTYENVKDIPKQKNKSDCGVFILKYAEYISRNAVINFTQENMEHLKKCMVYELIVQKLL